MNGGVLEGDELWVVLAALERWLRRHDYAGKDPYDMLNGTRLPAVVRRHRLARQAVIQLGKRSPVDLRPWLGVPQVRIAKGVGLVASGYAFLRDAGWDGPAEPRGRGLLDWLLARRQPASDPRAWGYEFDAQLRWAFYPAGTPNIVVTTFVSNAFLDWYERAGDTAHLDAARRAAEYILDELCVTDSGGPYFAYVPGVPTLIHNANLLGCGLIARLGALSGDASLTARALAAAGTSVVAQDARGRWPYGRGSDLSWADGYHTAYVLGSLHDVWRATGDPSVRAGLETGMRAYISGFFGSDGAPRFTDVNPYPVDVHCASSAVEVLLRAADVDERCASLARKVAYWALVNLFDPQGFFYFQKTRFSTNRIPYVRWSQAHMFRALAALAAAEAA